MALYIVQILSFPFLSFP